MTFDLVGQPILAAAGIQPASSKLAISTVGQAFSLRWASARLWAFCGTLPIALCGRQSCLQAAFQAAVERTTHAVRRYLSGFASRRRSAAKLARFVAYREGGLKARLLGFGSFVGQPILAAAGIQPACPAPDEFLGLHVAIPAGHYAKETLRSPVLWVCEPPERRLQARLPAPLRAVNGQSLQAGLPATRYLRQALCSKAREIRQISKRPAEAGRRLNACPTKHPKPRSAGRQARPHDR